MKDLVTALHTAARRFCVDRHTNWASRYTELGSIGKATTVSGANWTYSTSAYQLFPRYRLNEAILHQVEKTTGQSLRSLAEARASLLEAADRASGALLEEFATTREAVAAVEDELEAFRGFIHSVTEDQLKAVEPLPYRRVLGNEESADLWEKLNSVWKIDQAGHFWYPLADCHPDLNVVAFHEELWEARRGRDLLQRTLKQRNIQRCFLLRELGPPDFELDAALADPRYDGSESFMTSDFEWLMYVSHESSITVAGWLADIYRTEWPDWEDLTYGGPFHTDDLRGTWST